MKARRDAGRKRGVVDARCHRCSSADPGIGIDERATLATVETHGLPLALAMPFPGPWAILAWFHYAYSQAPIQRPNDPDLVNACQPWMIGVRPLAC